MKLSKLLSKLRIKSKSKQPQVKAPVKEPVKELVKSNNEQTTKSKEKTVKYPQSIFELAKNHGNDLKAQEVIVNKLREMDETARGYALDSLIDRFGEDLKIVKILDKFLNSLGEEDRIWALRDFAFHHGDLLTIRSLLSKHMESLNVENKYFLLTDLTVHHGEDVDVQKLIVKHIDELSNQYKYDILYCLSHLHGLNQSVQNLILSNLKDLSEEQAKEIFRGLVPKVARDLIEKHLDSLSEKNRNILVKNASKNKSEELIKPKEKKSSSDKLEKTEVMLLDLSNIKKSKNHLGQDSFEVQFNNPVKIYPYVDERNDDTQIGDAFLTIKNDKIYATVTLCPQLRDSLKRLNGRNPIYKPSGLLAIHKDGAKQMCVDFIYLVF